MKKNYKLFKLTITLFLAFIVIFQFDFKTLVVKAQENTTYYVSTTGDDNNPGTISEPFRSIYHAMYHIINPGDTLIVRGGTYYNETDGIIEGMEISNKNGSADAWYTVKNYPGEAVVINGQNKLKKGIGFSNSSYWHIEGINITNYTNAGIYIRKGCNNIQMDSLKIWNLNYPTYITEGVAGILAEGATYCSVKNCDIYNVGLVLNKPKDHGIYINTGSNNWIISNNRLHDNSGAGIQICVNSSNSIVSNNTIYNNHQWGVVIDIDSNGNTVKSNKFYGNLDSDIYLIHNAAKNTFINNIFASYSGNYNVAVEDDANTNNVFDFNIYRKSKGAVVYYNGVTMNFSEWKARSNEAQGSFSASSDIESLIPASGKNYTVKRLSGNSRYDTSKAISEEFNNGKLDNVIISSGLNFPDALSGSVLAKKINAPILLVGGNPAESQQAFDYVKNHLSNDGTIYILGGIGSVSESIKETFISMGFSKINRLSGSDRFGTNKVINDQLKVEVGTPVVIVSGSAFPDALSISSIAAIKGYPVILAEKDSIPAQALETLENIKPSSVYIIGGTGSISDSIKAKIKSITSLQDDNVIRISGSSRYETSINVADYFNLDGTTVTFANGENFPDALSGCVLAAKLNSPIVLINDSISKQKEYIDSTKYTQQIILGATGVISDSTALLLKK